MGVAKETIPELVGRIDGLIALLETQDTNRNHITVTHTQASNATFFVGIAVTACVATLALMLAFIVIENRSYAHLDNQVDQLRAWIDVHSREIGKLQAEQQKKP